MKILYNLGFSFFLFCRFLYSCFVSHTAHIYCRMSPSCFDSFCRHYIRVSNYGTAETTDLVQEDLLHRNNINNDRGSNP